MMTLRQRKLLQAIIDEFVNTAEAVGSAHLAQKYNLNISPATIRNEMADLVKMGYLAQTHTSSGRVPTMMGYKEFIKELMNNLEDLDVEAEAQIKENLFQRRFDIDELIYEALGKLSSETSSLAFGILENRIYYSGLSTMMSCPEFSDSVQLQKVLKAVEDHEMLKELLNKFTNTSDVRVLFGNDTGIPFFTDTTLVYKLIKFHGNNQGFLGIIGPMRMNYNRAIAIVDFVGVSINDMLLTW